MRAEWIFVLFAFTAGVAVPIQFAVNTGLRGAVGGPITVVALSFLVGTLALSVAVLAAREGAPNVAGLSEAPWWVWAGGFLGAYYVFASIILTPRIGAASTVGFVIAGQMVASIVLDQFGLLNLPVNPISFPKIAGAVLIIAGAILVLRS